MGFHEDFCRTLLLFPKWNDWVIKHFFGEKIESLRRILRISNVDMNLLEGYEKIT